MFVNKGDKLRICTDYKVRVCDKINTEAYPLLCIETIFSKLTGANLEKIDLSNAYWQFPLDEKSLHLFTLNTKRRLFRVTRLQQGLKTLQRFSSKQSTKARRT